MGTQDQSKAVEAFDPLTMETTLAEGNTLVMDEGELPNNRFSLWSTIGVQFSTTASPLAIGIYLQLVVGAGGSPYFFWCLLTAMILQFTTCISLAELSSAFPHTSGTAFWTSVLSPSYCSRFLTYLNGVAIALGWLMATCGTVVYAGQFSTAIGTVVHPDYQFQLWHVYLCSAANGCFSFILNTFLIRVLPYVTRFMILFINAVTLFIFTSLLVKANPKADPSTVFLEVQNATGWSSDGVVFLIALLPGGMVISLFDAATHLSEELPRPDRQVWQVMIINAVINGVTSLAMTVALLFSLAHPENLLDPIGRMPILQLCWDAWPNKRFVLAVATCYLIVQTFATTALHFTLSRIIWSLSRTKAFPYSSWLSKVRPGMEVPLNAVTVAVVCSLLLCLLVLGPSTVQKGIFGSAAIFFLIAYEMPIVLLLLRGRSILPTNRTFSLGQAGSFVNIISVSWSLIFFIFVCFPTHLPVTPDSMNWTSVCAVGLLSLGILNWFPARRRLTPMHGLLVQTTRNGGSTETRDGLN
ncbi:amino acid/polyamine transporter I [Aspergillus nidulans var. acristatus]